MRILAQQLNLKIGDLDGNTQKIIHALDRGRKQGVDLVLFSELTICGYPPEDLLFHHAFMEAIKQHLSRIVEASSGITVVIGLPRPNHIKGEKHLFNSACVIHDRKILGFQDKWLLPNYDIFNERRYFEPGHEMQCWEIEGKKIGIIICEDIWHHSGYVALSRYERDPVLELADKNLDVLLNLSASPYQYQKPDVRVEVCAKAARTLQCPVILCCQVGSNDQLLFDGYSVFVDQEGKLRQLGKGFEEDEMYIDFKAPVCSIQFTYHAEKDLFRALSMGVRDYLAKQNFTKAIIGMSGGIDSSLVACVAVDALGQENVLGVTMPSRYSSKGSLEHSKQLADALGMKMLELSIDHIFQVFLDSLNPFFEGKPQDVTEENLQARIRGNILMALSNKMGHIVLSTGNKSEMALGYSTLYGDMCGGLGVIADVPKTKVYELCRLINREKPIIPQAVIDKPPSAELRPNQQDADALPDYGIVDKVLVGYVEDYLSVSEISQKYEIPIETVMNLVKRIHGAEYKRRQGPPVLRVSKKSFGIGRRYPIVQGWM